MTWVDLKKALPKHLQEVLIRHQNNYYLGIYHQDKGGFRLRDGSFLLTEMKDIRWLALSAP